MSAQQNIALVRRLFEEFYTKGNLTAADQFFTNETKLHDAAIPTNFRGGISQLRQLESIYRTAFPNKTTKIDDIFASDELVVVRWTTQGTQKGELQGVSPTGRNIKVSGISIYRCLNGKILEIYQNWDRLSLLEQIGVINPLEALHG